ncbi:hypothetical protein LWI29_029597 [Acer saccharum]|uniref:Integrase catalytic domain-containing protein n=1 Tax=Acer saccharum TaxID=4024 RepID=A0AA39TL09_ACESA|nr:hypothetical protein LWI29_029597 [Acer saccharum]
MAMVENETGLKIKKLRSDNGGKYEDNEFKKFCYQSGIKLIRTVPGTPQQNGTAERMNRTLTERARSMGLQSGLPKQFWAEAVLGRSSQYSSVLDQQRTIKAFGPRYTRRNLDWERDEFGYKLWDDQNRKMIRSRDVVFNEKVMYKDRNTETSEKKEPDYFGPDDVSGGEIVERGSNQEVEEQGVQPQVEKPIPQNEVLSPQSPIGQRVLNPQIGNALRRSPQAQSIPRRSTRPHVPNKRYLHYLLLTDAGEPECYDEACQGEDASKWELVMKDEMKSLVSNQTWELAKLPEGKKALQNKWVFRIKEEHDGSKRYKARLVVKGFQQKEGIDYTDIFSPVVKLTTIRLVLSIVAANGLYLEQLDVKTAFLHGDLEEEIYMQQPEGFVEKGNEEMVCRLTKSL